MYVKGTRARTRVMKKMALNACRMPSSPACVPTIGLCTPRQGRQVILPQGPFQGSPDQLL